MSRSFVIFAILLLLVILLAPSGAAAQGTGMPTIKIGVEEAQSPRDLSVALKILLMMTVLTLAPSILIMMTSFTRIVVVLSLMRQAIGSHQAPANQIVVGLALFLTLFIMLPVFKKVNAEGLQPYFQEKIGWEEAYEQGAAPIRDFMLKQVREKDLKLFVKISGMKRPKDISEIPTHVIIPAFMISELHTAFTIGFMIYMPFLVVDMLIASILMSMGMMMLPPIMISLPFKLMIFVLSDGWYLVVGSLVKSFN